MAKRSATVRANEAEESDPIRERLLDAAARVFAAKGYSGTKILDVAKEAKLSIGAVYPRFGSKKALLVEAVATRSIKGAIERSRTHRQVANFLVQTAENLGPMTDAEAIQVEAYVAARREPEVAESIAEARHHWRAAIEPGVQAALADGTLRPNADIDSVVFFLETVHLGLLLQRGARNAPINRKAWSDLVRRVVDAIAGGQPRTRKRGSKQHS